MHALLALQHSARAKQPDFGVDAVNRAARYHCVRTGTMALRDFVTGSDMCTPDEGAGPSNAAATFANSLLGRSAKDQERLREVCTSANCNAASSSSNKRWWWLSLQHTAVLICSAVVQSRAIQLLLTDRCQESKACLDLLCMETLKFQQWTLLLKQLLKVSARAVSVT